MTRRAGARSLAGALSAYARAALGATLLLALLLAGGYCRARGPAQPVLVRLPAGGLWSGAVLRPLNGSASWELRPGDEVRLPPGAYALRLFGPAGTVTERRIEVAGRALDLPPSGVSAATPDEE